MQSRRFFQMILVVLLCLVGHGARANGLVTPLTEEERDWLWKNAADVVFVYDQQFPPFEFSDEEGRFTGLGADYLHLVEEKLGVKFSYKTHPDWNTVLNMLRTGEGDAITALTIIKDREDYLIYTNSYVEVPCVLLVRSDDKATSTMEDLGGRRVAVVNGYATHSFLKDNYASRFEIVPVPTAQAGLRDLAFEVVDAFVVNLGLAAYYIEKDGLANIRVAGDAVYTYRFSFAVRKDLPILRDILQKGLDSITDEESQALRDKWYNMDGDRKHTLFLLRIGGLTLLAALAIIVVFYAVNRTLKKRVRERTEALEFELEEKERIAEELRLSQERYALVVQGANDGIWDWDVASDSIYFSPRWKSIIGYAEHEIDNDVSEWMDRIHPDDKDRVLRVNRECRDGVRDQFEIEYRLRHRDGSYRWILGRGTGVRDDSGRAYRMAGTHSDITGRKRATNELARSNRLLRAVLHQAPFAIVIAQGNAKSWIITASNKEAERLLGINEEAVGTTGMVDGEFVNAETIRFRAYDLDGWELPRHKLPLALAMTQEKVLSGMEMVVVHTSGEEYTVLVNAVPVHDEQGEVVAGIAIFLDITDRKRAEEERRQLRNMLQSIIDSMPSVLVALDGEGRVTQWNTEAEHMTGISFADAEGRSLSDVMPELAGETTLIDAALAERKPQVSPRRAHMMGEGAMRYEDLTVYPLVFEGFEGAVVRIDDVTERARIEEMMIQAEKMLSVGGLAAGMAHEINNPLGIIMQCAESISRRVSPELAANTKAAGEIGIDLGQMRQYMDERGISGYIDGIRDAGSRAAKIVQNMLNFSRSSESRIQACDLNSLLDSTIELAANDYDLKKKFDFRQIEIERHYATNLPHTLCSSTEIEQVFLNLLKNAAQAMAEADPPPETPRIIIRTALQRAEILIELTDNGPGMPEKVRKRVFEPFFTTKSVGTGTGLGLSVSYFIICTNHGGQFDVESAPGKGAKFTIRLPVREAAA